MFLLTTKPILYIANVSEEQIEDPENDENVKKVKEYALKENAEVSKQYPEKTRYMLRRMVAQLEAEGAQYPIGFEGQTVKPNIEYFEK